MPFSEVLANSPIAMPLRKKSKWPLTGTPLFSYKIRIYIKDTNKYYEIYAIYSVYSCLKPSSTDAFKMSRCLFMFKI